MCEVRLNNNWGDVLHTAVDHKAAMAWCDENGYRTTKYGDGYVVAVKRATKKGK